jgi:mannose-6-phosphate isomerase-like protein (cupin superfamily)
LSEELFQGRRHPGEEADMPVTITRAADVKALNVLGEELRPLTPAPLTTGVAEGGTGASQAELGVAVFDTLAPFVLPGEAGPPPHRHPWAETYVVLAGTLAVFDGQEWQDAPAGACVCVPPGQWHSYRNGTPDCHFLTITGPGRAREFFECADAEVGTWPPDMAAATALAARFGVEIMPDPAGVL